MVPAPRRCGQDPRRKTLGVHPARQHGPWHDDALPVRPFDIADRDPARGSRGDGRDDLGIPKRRRIAFGLDGQILVRHRKGRVHRKNQLEIDGELVGEGRLRPGHRQGGEEKRQFPHEAPLGGGPQMTHGADVKGSQGSSFTMWAHRFRHSMFLEICRRRTGFPHRGVAPPLPLQAIHRARDDP